MRSIVKPLVIFVASAILIFSLAIGSEARMAVRIGVNLPMTGPAAVLGVSTLEGIKLAADEVNERGGVLGRPVEIIIIDNYFITSQSVMNYQRFALKEKVSAVIGDIFHSGILATYSLASKYRLPTISPSLYYVQLEKSPFFFQTAVHRNIFWKALVTYATREQDSRHFYLIGSDYNKRSGDFDILEKLIRTQSANVSERQIYPFMTTDFSPFLLKSKLSRSDGIILCGTGNDLIKILQKADRVCRNAKFFILGTPVETPYLSGKLPREQQIFAVFEYLAEDFIQKIEKKRTGVDKMVAAHGFDALKILVQAIERARSTDSDAINKQLAARNIYDTTSGKIRFSEETGMLKPMVIKRWTGDVFKVVKVYRELEDRR